VGQWAIHLCVVIIFYEQRTKSEDVNFVTEPFYDHHIDLIFSHQKICIIIISLETLLTKCNHHKVSKLINVLKSSLFMKLLQSVLQ